MVCDVEHGDEARKLTQSNVPWKSEGLAHLNEGVDDTNVGACIEHLVEVGLSVHQLQLVELFVILSKKIK